MMLVAIDDQESFKSSVFPESDAQFEGQSSKEVKYRLCFQTAGPSSLNRLKHIEQRYISDRFASIIDA